MRKNRKTLLLTAVAFAAGATAGFGAPSLQRIAYLTPQSGDVAISRDGATLIGNTNIESAGFGIPLSNVFTWRPSEGFRNHSSVYWLSNPQSSADGSIVAGSMRSASGFFQPRGAFRWDTQTDQISVPPSSTSTTYGLALTPDGNTIVYSNWGARMWNGNTERVLTTTGNYTSGCISDDANAVGLIEYYGHSASRWTLAGGLKALPFPPGVALGDISLVMSADGSQMFACGYRDGEVLLVRWTFDHADNASADVLFVGPRGNWAQVAGTTTDGSLVAFYANGRSFVWIDGMGTMDLDAYLVSKGAVAPQPAPRQVRGMSGNGLAFAGVQAVEGGYDAWYVNLNPGAKQFCPADLNYDGNVDDADFVRFASMYDTGFCEMGFPPSQSPCADFNGDTSVDDADFVLFVSAYETFVCP